MYKIWKLYEKRVNKYEAEGMTRSAYQSDPFDTLEEARAFKADQEASADFGDEE